MSGEVRQRKTGGEPGDSKAAMATAVTGELAPAWLKPYADKIGPALTKLGELVDKLAPHIVKCYDWIEKMKLATKDHHPELLLQMAFGILLMFFGGSFVTTIACFEAVRMTGWSQMKKALESLWENYKKVEKASKEDDTRDDDGDGVADVRQISSQELVSRKLKLAITTCDPTSVSTALNGLYASSISVMAALRSKFARVVTLGATIGEALDPHAVKYLHPTLQAMVPKEHHKWIDFFIGYACRSIGVTIAWAFQRVISAVHSSLRGAFIFTEAFAEFTAKKGYPVLAEGYWDEGFAAVCALSGLSMQLSNWFSLPWLLYLPLFPLVLLEKFLAYLVGMG
eukprot:g439.t1